jgi:hypothetical protein
VQEYEERLISAIRDKVCKARKGRDIGRPLTLSVCLNEYVNIYLGQADLDGMGARHQELVDQMTSFAEGVLLGPRQ